MACCKRLAQDDIVYGHARASLFLRRGLNFINDEEFLQLITTVGKKIVFGRKYKLK